MKPGILVFTVIALGGCGVAYAIAGVSALQGFALGAGSGAFNMLAMWGVITILGNAYRQTSKPGGANLFLGLAFLVKLPIYVLAGLMAQTIGGAAIGAFLAAIAVVYSCLIWWAFTRQ